MVLADDGSTTRLNTEVEALVFRAVRELLMNVTKHARTTMAKVSLRAVDGYLDVSVEDAGVGFNAADAAPESGGGRFGLFSIQEQIRHIGGTVEVVSAPGHGTRVTLRARFT